MAVNVSYVYIFILCIHNFISKAAVERRFSDFKRCADEECSMLLCRGKAFSDFTGPDCRFLSFKKGETIYVYYKLSGQRTNIWDGSVGNCFGYFNKDQLVINHIYTEKELEIPAELSQEIDETDFVCFDSGHDKFDSYDIDSLLGSSLLLTDKEESVQVTTETFYLNKSAESTTVEVDEPPPEVTLLENDEIDRDVPEDIDKVVEVPDDDLRHFEALESSLPQPETLDTKGVESNTVLETTAERIKDYLQKDQQRTEDSVPYSVVEPEEGEIKETPSEPLSKDDPELENAPSGFSEGRPIPELKTTHGITFDVVTSDDEDTWKVTPYDEEDKESDKTEYQQDEESDYHLRETPLLAFSEESSNLEHENIPESYQTDEEDSQSEVPHTQKQDSKDNNLWSSFGDTVFNIVSGGERIAHVAGSEKDDEEEDDDEGEITPEEPPKIEEPKESEEVEQPSELIFEEPADSNFSEDAVKVPDEDSQTLRFENESEEGDIEPSTPPADEASPSEHTEALAENLTVDDSPVPKQLSQTDMLSDFDSKTNKSEQKQAVELPIQKEESRDFSQVENTFKQGGTEHFRLFREPYQKVPDPSKNTMVKESHQELSIEEDSIHLKGEDIEEELLEDENAVLSSSKTEHTDEKDTESLSEFGSEQPNNYTQTDVVSSDVLDVVQHNEAIDIEPEVHETENDAESHTPSLKDKVLDPLPNKETEYSDDVLRLTLLRDHFKDEDMECFQKILGLQNLFRVEFLFSDLELKAARLSQTNTSEDIEKVLEAILEASETPILDEIERMLDAQGNADLQQEAGEFVEEAAVLDDFQELVFTLRQRYSTARNSALMAVGSQLHLDTDGDMSDDAEEEKTFPHSVEDTDKDNLTVTETGEEIKAPEKPAHDGHKRPDMGIEEDGGYFNRNKDNQPSSTTLEEIQRGPQTILENTLDMGLSVDMDHPPSGSLESPPVTDFHEDEQSGSSFVSVLILSGCLITLFYEYLGIYGVMMGTSLPEQWKPGPDFYGVSWEPVLVTAGAGVIGFLFLFWRSILSVKSKSYLTTEKEMADRMKRLEQEKKEILQKVAELQKRGEELKEKQKLSEKSATSSLEKIQELENIVQEMERQNERLDEENNLLTISFDKERANTAKREDMMSEMDKTIEKLKRSKKKTQDALSKSTILMDEAKLCEDARNVQHQVLENDIATLKEENVSLHHAAKLWEEKHRETSEQIKVYQKSQKDLEDSLVQKDHNVEVLSDLLGDLEACDDLKGGVVANGEASNDKQTIIRNRIKQMMDVSRVQTTLSVVEEERDRFMTKLLNEERSRKELEEQFQKLEHDILLVKSDKNHLENQYKTLQQKNEIMTEMYQQKENALQQKLTKEEFERRNKEARLTEVDGKALEEEVKVCRQRIKEIQDELKWTEKSYKAQIIEQEQKSHENWVIARAAERALFDEKKEATNLRNLLTDMSSKLNELRRPLFKPTPGMVPMPLRREPRPPSDPHSRYPPDHKHPVAARPDTMAHTVVGEQGVIPWHGNLGSSNSRPQGPGSLLVSPISSLPDSSPGPLRPVISHPSGLCYRPLPGPHHIPPPPPFMPPVYRPDNGHSSMMPPGPPLPNGHPPGPMIPPGHRPPLPGAYGPPSPHNRCPPPPSHYGPVPPPFGVSCSPPMARPMRPQRTYVHYGPLDHSIPVRHLPSVVAPCPPHVGPRDFPVQPQAPHGHDSSVAPQPSAGPRGQGQDYSSLQATAAPQDSVSSATAEP